MHAAVQRAIADADSILPGRVAPPDARDARWQAIIRVGAFVGSHPEAVWGFALRWGKHAQRDLRDAVATCLLEHLLEHHFDDLFPRIRAAALKSVRFADTLGHCWGFGEALTPHQARRLRALHSELRRAHASAARVRR
jgi:hypothetical protein